ncbi:hypothetical protein VPH35_083246 [Triticum aestivum]
MASGSFNSALLILAVVRLDQNHLCFDFACPRCRQFRQNCVWFDSARSHRSPFAIAFALILLGPLCSCWVCYADALVCSLCHLVVGICGGSERSVGLGRLVCKLTSLFEKLLRPACVSSSCLFLKLDCRLSRSFRSVPLSRHLRCLSVIFISEMHAPFDTTVLDGCSYLKRCLVQIGCSD